MVDHKPVLKVGTRYIYQLVSNDLSWIVKANGIEDAIMFWLDQLEDGTPLGRLVGVLIVGDHSEHLVFFDTNLMIAHYRKHHDHQGERNK
jgi:hypothetical protein